MSTTTKTPCQLRDTLTETEGSSPRDEIVLPSDNATVGTHCTGCPFAARCGSLRETLEKASELAQIN